MAGGGSLLRPPPASYVPVKAKDLQSKNLDELKALAKDLGVPVADTKEQLIGHLLVGSITDEELNELKQKRATARPTKKRAVAKRKRTPSIPK